MTRRVRLLGEGLGTAFLLIAVVGSGIMGERLAGGNTAIALLANSLATGCALAVLIFVLGPLSGAHFNPVVTIATAGHGELAWGDVAPYVAAQLVGGLLGVVAAHGMFGLAAVTWSTHVRAGASQWWSEAIATFGLLVVVRACQQRRSPAAPWLIGAYITAAYWFTASTSFANPAVTIARAATDTFAGIRPFDVPGFVAAQVLGALGAFAITQRVPAGSP